MDRRFFILASTGLVAMAASPLMSLAGAAGRAPAGDHHALLRFDPDASRFLPHTDVAGVAHGTPLHLQFEGFHASARGGVCSLQIDTLTGAPGQAVPWRSIAWHYQRGDTHGSSRASGFDVETGSLHGLELSFRAQPLAAQQRELLDLTASAAGLVPGRYVLIISAQPLPPIGSLAFSGDWSAPLAASGDFDYLSIHIGARADDVDLSLRADLACLQAERECAATA
jgi:hypothetical protein